MADEKYAVTLRHVDEHGVKLYDSDTSLQRVVDDSDDERVKRIKRKVDLRLSAILALLYCVNQIDRTNLPNALVAGMDEDLNLIGNRYTIIVLVFFPFHILFNPVTTVLARKIGPRPFLTGITLAFGLVVIGFRLVKDWTTLIDLRILLGTFESCFFPYALIFVSGGGIIRCTVLRLQDAPQYIPGLITCFLAAGLTIVSVAATCAYMHAQNRKQAQGKITIEGVEGFRYTM